MKTVIKKRYCTFTKRVLSNVDFPSCVNYLLKTASYCPELFRMSTSGENNRTFKKDTCKEPLQKFLARYIYHVVRGAAPRDSLENIGCKTLEKLMKTFAGF